MNKECVHGLEWRLCLHCSAECMHGLWPVESCTICNPYRYDENEVVIIDVPSEE